MSTIKITNIANKDNDGGPVVSGISTFSSTESVKFPVGTTGQRVGIESGSLRYNSDTNELEFYNGTSWATIINTTRSVSARGLFGGGTTPSFSNVIDYITIATTGNATDFGDLLNSKYRLSACSNNHGGLS